MPLNDRMLKRNTSVSYGFGLDWDWSMANMIDGHTIKRH